MKEKMTKKEMFEMLLEIEEVASNEILVNFINHEMELLQKKSSKTKVNEENIKLTEMVYEELSKFEEPMTISDLLNKSETLSNYVLENQRKLTPQKVRPMLSTLINDGKVTNTKDSKNSYYSVVA